MQKRPAKRGRSQTTNPRPKRVRNAFLTHRLPPISPTAVVRSDQNYITRENYEYLLASTERYAELMGKSFDHHRGLSVGEDIANLYRALRNLLGGEVNVNIETEGTKLVFVLWRHYQWGDYNFYWVPVKFVERLNPRLKRLAITFLHQFIRSNHLTTTNNSVDFEMMVENYYERSQDSAEDDPEHLERMASEYHNSGHVGKLMHRIETKNYYKRLDLALAKYTPQSPHEEGLIVLMTRGLEFIGGQSIMSLAYDQFHDEKLDDDLYIVHTERTITLTYDVYSEMETELRGYINSEIGEGYEVMPAATLTLRPDCDAIFTMDDYPTRFFGYLDDLLDFLTKNSLWTRTY